MREFLLIIFGWSLATAVGWYGCDFYRSITTKACPAPVLSKSDKNDRPFILAAKAEKRK